MPATTLPAPAPDVEVEVEGGYGWQIAAVDIASVALVLSNSSGGTTAGGLTYVLGGPIIHGAHNHGGRMGASLVLRAGLPILLALGGAALTSHKCGPEDYDCDTGLGGAILGFGVGMLTAMVVDSAVLARPVEVHKRTSTTWAPQIAVTPQRVGLGVIGRF